MTRTVLITGAGGGLGAATADLFAQQRWQVFAGDLIEPSPRPSIVPVRLDVTDAASCAAAAALIGGQHDGLDAVVNFAGVLEVGPLVEIDPSRMRRSLDVNVLGTFLVNQAVFPLILRAQGRVVNISSEAGRNDALALSAPYAVTKHAVEAYSDALRRELAPLGVTVVVVRPGAFRTTMTAGIADRFAVARKAGSPFEAMVERIGTLAVKADAKARDPRILAEAVVKAVTAPKPRLRYNVKHDGAGRMLSLLPDAVIDRVMARVLR